MNHKRNMQKSETLQSRFHRLASSHRRQLNLLSRVKNMTEEHIQKLDKGYISKQELLFTRVVTNGKEELRLV